MKIRIRHLLILLCLFLLPLSGFSTHQRAAEILYRHLSGLTYEITLISYTFTPSPANAYRDFLLIDWGDGTSSEIPRVEKIYLPNDITFNRYTGQHTFQGPSTYTISCEDPNRNGGILNIPNSINTPLFIYSELVISPFMGYNNSPVLLIPPIDNACVDQPFYHNPGAYDIDGDSLSYRPVTCMGAQGLPIPGYTLSPATNTFHLDSITGDLFWDSPPQQGEYNVAILIEEWRKGIKIGSVLRDMQIIVVACDNEPPVILDPADTCIEAGKTLTFIVRAYDPDSNSVTLTGTGGPLLLDDHPANIFPNPSTGSGHTAFTFSWSTVCGHVKRLPYRMFFKAEDDAVPVHLVNITSMDILVVGPAPENLTATALGTTITLTWDNYACQNAKGYYIYRKMDSTGYVHGYCQTGVPSYLGYSRIDQINDIAQTSYLDDNKGMGLVQGVKYCYMIVAFYEDKAVSYASNEACAQLRKDVAVITNVSVRTTHPVTGSMYVAWSKPTEIDTVLAPGPYMYMLYRSRDMDPFIAIDSMADLNDTIFVDTLLDTRDNPYRYRIDLYNVTPGNRFLIGPSQVASSIFILLSPTDKKMRLYWNTNVPWTNYRYDIYRRDPGFSFFDSVGSSIVPAYVDHGLINGEEYCYYIKSTGDYSATGFVSPIINFSQISCDITVDNVPPCSPFLHVKTDCDQALNILSWTNPGDTCSTDIARYYIYYTPDQGSPPVLADSISNPFDTVYLHKPDLTIAGCYAVVAIDSVGNRSAFSNIVCVDYTNCPVYTLPNVFTPNGDGKNDLLRPFPYTSVDHINLTLFDRWGKKVFETNDPDINWDGKDLTTGQPCSDGVYFYVCDVFEITLTGLFQRTLKGSVTILR